MDITRLPRSFWNHTDTRPRRISEAVPATPAQITYLRSLIVDAEHMTDAGETQEARIADFEARCLPHLTAGFASTLIANLAEIRKAREASMREYTRKVARATDPANTPAYAAPVPRIQGIMDALSPGMYTLNGDYFRVVKSRGSDRMYAQKLTPGIDGDNGKFAYAPGVVAQLRPNHRLDRESAALFGRKTGQCVACGRNLTNTTSIEEGIGPICGGRL